MIMDTVNLIQNLNCKLVKDINPGNNPMSSIRIGVQYQPTEARNMRYMYVEFGSNFASFRHSSRDYNVTMVT